VQKAGVAFLVANRVDVAAEAGADGVHLDDAKDNEAARQRLGKEASIGVSTLNPRDMTIEEVDADYVAFGGFDDPAPSKATLDALAWWAPFFVIPSVVAGVGNAAEARQVAGMGGDFVAIAMAIASNGAGIAALLPEIAAALRGA
jgi:thiamine-phosphate pyrophosphorylase